MTNAEAIKQMLDDIEECDMIASYIDCPYVYNPNCKYDGGNDHSSCVGCKMEWLQKEWED